MSSQILYDDGYDGIVNGYVWQHFATLGSSWLGPLDSIWEHPNRIELEMKAMQRFATISQSRRRPLLATRAFFWLKVPTSTFTFTSLA